MEKIRGGQCNLVREGKQIRLISGDQLLVNGHLVHMKSGLKAARAHTSGLGGGPNLNDDPRTPLLQNR